MKTKKTLKFSKETVALLDKNSQKKIKGGFLPTILNCNSVIICPSIGKCSIYGC